MLYTYLSAPFSDSVRHHQFTALAQALAADAAAPDTVLLGQLPVEAAGQQVLLDAVVLRPHSITLLLLVPGGGLLHIPDFRFSAWRLAGTPLTGTSPNDGADDNPYQQFQRQREALARWLAGQLPAETANLQFISGLVVFAEPVRFGPEVEARMSEVPAASTFHLLPDPSRFTRRLAQLATPEIDLSPADLRQLAAELGAQAQAAPVTEPETAPVPAGPTDLLRQKAGQLWRWLGAEDLDELDRTDTGYEVADVAARNQEKAQLEELRASLQAELSGQLQALEAREAERELVIYRLREELATTPPVAPETATLQARLSVENQEKEALEATIRDYRAESEARNQQLDRKIQQLDALINRLSATPAAAPAPAAPAMPSATAAPVAVPPEPVRPAPAPAAAVSPQPSSPPKATIGRPAEAVSGWLPDVQGLGHRFVQLLGKVGQVPRPALLAGLGGLLLVFVVWLLLRNTNQAPTPFRQGQRWGLLTSGGDTLLPARYASIGEFRNERAVVEQDGVFGFVDAEGKEVVPPAYDALYPYAGGYARARVDKLYTFLDEQGAEFGAYYYNARDFAEGYAAVLDHRGWHYITGPDEPAKPPVIFQEAYSFDQGLARIKTQGTFTYIRPAYLADTTEGTAPFGRYRTAADFDTQGRARVLHNGRSFLLNRDGEEVEQ
ncbi:WG repeat-containing protein [Hymenobacter weizhouensis]|uniref:WG repeat-containing protein n=1 Tax=Hymenobacter sp. YIM 151500-1 TaxID=2987689 RepID=UPI0022260447|nr:WG repeat-containing protein [Hymenobacter sp. YIM 151500-1]UYZ62587.1 WG repeat-containing protein [Hymenobacter sp. YIM 151500-1]